ncbi:MAG: hypothetical protein ACTSWK_02010 [Promethearchaeota archaeon]
MKILNSLDNSHLFVKNNDDDNFEVKYIEEIEKGQEILLSDGVWISKSSPYFSLDLPEGTLEIEVCKKKKPV